MSRAPETVRRGAVARRSPLLLAGLLLLLLLAGLTYQLWQARQEAIDTAKQGEALGVPAIAGIPRRLADA